jgi:hypothetical protein
VRLLHSFAQGSRKFYWVHPKICNRETSVTKSIIIYQSYKQHNHHSQQQQLYPYVSAQQPECCLAHCAAMTEVGLAQAAAASLPSLAAGRAAASCA